jgi:hypothetical protein
MPRTCLGLAIGLLVGMGIAFAQSPRDLKVADHEKRVLRELYEVGKRHLDIGLWARDAGLHPQATTQFMRADEASQGKHEGARTVLRVMRQYGDAFWEREQKRPPRSLLAEYSRRAVDADKRDRRSFLELGKSALGCERVDEAKQFTREALRLGAAVQIDPKGKHRIDGLPIPTELADWLLQQTAVVGEGTRVFEPAAKGGYTLQGFAEQASERVIVRTDLGAAKAKELHTLAAALLPHLEARLDGAPSRPLLLLVFGKRTDFVAYLQSLGVPAAGSGLAEYGSFQTIVCAEGLPDPDLHAIALHELSHLFFFGVAPAAMPDWYAEGFAESFGGQGTFRWDGKELQLGDVMTKYRLDAMRQAPMPLAEFLAASAEQLLLADRDKGLRFYAQAWAFQRFLRSPDGPWSKRFAHWEALCRGMVLGGNLQRYGDAGPAQAQFQRLFGADFAAIEAKFLAWLPTL